MMCFDGSCDIYSILEFFLSMGFLLIKFIIHKKNLTSRHHHIIILKFQEISFLQNGFQFILERQSGQN